MYEGSSEKDGVKGTFSLDFKPDKTLLANLSLGENKAEINGHYKIIDSRIHIFLPGIERAGGQFEFDRAGPVLEGEFLQGMTRFIKRGDRDTGASPATEQRASGKPPTGALTRRETIDCQTRVRGLVRAAITHMQEKQRPPADLQALIDANYITAEMLSSPCGPVADGQGDYWHLFDARLSSFDSTLIIVYDRAAFARGGLVPVGFADDHVETLKKEEFEELVTKGTVRGERRLPADRYAGVDFRFPPPQ